MFSAFVTPTPLQYFASLVADDESLPLVEAAASLAQEDDPQFDLQSVVDEIEGMVARLRRRVSAEWTPVQRLRALNQHFFGDLGFAGNVNDYYDPGNSLLGTVLRTRRGIPITLAVLYIEMANSIGLTARGVSFPGHFLVKLEVPGDEVVVDPFTGQSLSSSQLEERLLPYRRQGRGGEPDAPLGAFLQTASSRQVLARMLRNLKEIYRSSRDWRRLLSVSNRLVVLLPQAWEERRDRGMVHAELGDQQPAVDDLSAYLRNATDAVDRDAVRVSLSRLNRSGHPG